MPLYEYYCSDCKSKFELLVSHQHADDAVCMKCQSENVRRLLSVFAAQRSGSNDDTSYGDLPPAIGGCGCGGGSCGCH
ncbi:zinc ribbon domain-containing protein [Ktedonosporobacter rubrisoli]|uniref:Zinc ribbon domain-containing protein n=1 Tax=Ktedonosporobacter rubrisoli TaxID=2509675 RepID=A0A4P6JYR4_KTERU|nr:zinc ribbon domain-containing protein [Ktedonosporobacter rubrisoli]